MKFTNIEDLDAQVFNINLKTSSNRPRDTVVAPFKLKVKVSTDDDLLGDIDTNKSILVTPEEDLPLKVYNLKLVELRKSTPLLKENYLSEFLTEKEKEKARENLGVDNEIDKLNEKIKYIQLLDTNTYLLDFTNIDKVSYNREIYKILSLKNYGIYIVKLNNIEYEANVKFKDNGCSVEFLTDTQYIIYDIIFNDIENFVQYNIKYVNFD